MKTLIFFLIFSFGLKAHYVFAYALSESFMHSRIISLAGRTSSEKIPGLSKYEIFSFMHSKQEFDTPSIISQVDKFLEFQQKSNSKDQIFVHIDRNRYKPGDTLYFQAYIRNQFTSKFESGSRSMYALLYNDLNEIVDSSRFIIQGYTSPGWMLIPFDASKGKYHFVAFTSMMQNFNPLDAYQTDIYVDTKRSSKENFEITYNKENYTPGDSLEATIKLRDERGKPINRQKFWCSLMACDIDIITKSSSTNSNGESNIKFIFPDTITKPPKLRISTKKEDNKLYVAENFDISFKKQNIELTFLPECGTLVAGLEQKIGFNATNSAGESVNIEGLLKDANGKIIDTIRSGIYGPGLFTCKPEEGMYVEIINGFSSKKIWPVTNIKNTGILMSVKPINNKSFAIEIKSNNYNGEMAFVSGAMNINQIFSEQLILNKKQRIVINTEHLLSGIAQITLFNHELKPIAERLIYINAEKRLKFNIKTNHDTNKPGQETELTITIADGNGNLVEGYFSMAIIDSLSGYNAEIFTPGIEYTLNYNQYFLENIPSKVLAKGIENISSEQRDLMLMVFGWKKFNWDFDKVQNSNIVQSIDYDIIQMKILNKSKKENMKLNLVELPLEEGSILSLQTNKNGEIILPIDSLAEDTRTIMMLQDTRNKKSITGAMLNIPCNEEYFYSNKLFTSQPTIPNYTIVKSTSKPDPYNLSSIEDIKIEEITVSGKRNREEVYINEEEKMYRNVNIHSISGKKLEVCGDFDEALRKAVPTLKIGPDENGIFGVYINPRISIEKDEGGKMKPLDPALIVLNGDPLVYDGYSTVKYIHPIDIISISVLKGYHGYAMYGVKSLGGVIFVNTKSGSSDLNKHVPDREIRDPKDQMAMPINIYRPNIEFYHPSKSEIDKDPLLQTSSTIYWQSEIYFDGEEPVKIKYPNLKNDKNFGTIMISINGVSFNNMPGSGKASYQIRE